MIHWRWRNIAKKPELAAMLSGLLLFAAFPPLAWNAAVWVALVPLLVVAARQPAGTSFRAGLGGGLAFWWLSIAWLARASGAGWLLLGLYCALFIAVFSMLSSLILSCRKGRPNLETLLTLFIIPAIWVGLEYIRATLFTGFPWNQLGVALASALPLIQCAEWGGVYAVSFLVAFINTALALFWIKFNQTPRPAWWRMAWPLAAGLSLLLLVWMHGSSAIRRVQSQAGGTLRVALVQLNIPQFEKWAAEYGAAIEARLQQITSSAIQRHNPELVVWPETAVPAFVRGCPSTEELIANLLKAGVPILVGAMDYAENGAELRYFNSSFLFEPEQGLTQKYEKQHLVIFGEYVPLSHVLPFLRWLTPIEESFTAGTIQTIFRLGSTHKTFAVLICFEDTVAALARNAVRAGARLIINQTNDAWFDPSWASRQHMLQGIFRCIENRTPCARSTNTGITCFIDRVGKVSKMLPPGHVPNTPPACTAQTIILPDPEMPLTAYTIYGDLFAQICLLGATLALLMAGWIRLYKKRLSIKC